MDDDDVQHEIVRFRRDEIADLQAMPSAAAPDELLPTPPRTAKSSSRKWRPLGYAALSVCLLFVAVWGGLRALSSSSFVSDQMHTQISNIITRAVGPDVASNIGPVRLGLSGAHLALEIDGLGLSDRDSRASLLQADELKFRLRLWPLLFGQAEVASSSISGAVITLNDNGGGNSKWIAALMDKRGLVDPDQLPGAAFASLDQFVAGMRRAASEEVEFQDITIKTAQPGGSAASIAEATITRTDEALVLEGVTGVGAQKYDFSGSLDIDPPSQAVRAFTLLVEDEPAEGIDKTTFTFAGDRNANSAPKLVASLSAKQRELDLGRRGILKSDVAARLRVTEGEGKVEIEQFNIATGQSRFNFTGAAGPLRQAGDPLAYRFELVSNNSLIAPEGSSESPLPAGIKLAGDYDVAARRLNLSQIAVGAKSGQATGTATIVFATGHSPAIKLNLGLSDMAVAEVKQLWPWLTAGSARRWVMDKLFGGEVEYGEINYDVAIGRLDDRLPMTAAEVSGNFTIEGTRFDTTGLMPPVRDATGAVKFAGDRVDVSLQSGTAYVADGQTVSLSNGTLAIENTRAIPVIGKLDLDVAGTANAVAQLASLEPIRAFQSIDLKPEDFSGTVTGHVTSDLPLQKGVDRKLLDWRVALDFRDLGLARPFAAQKVANADGSIVLDSRQAIIKAKAELNGLLAELDLVQPLGGSDVAIKRDITLTLDAKARAAVAPGLDQLVTGSLDVKVDARGANRLVEADLTQAKLDLPWIGWAKGAGIPAKASFTITPDRDIRDFRLSGKSFSARGDIDLDGGAFKSARMSQVAINAQDSFTVTVSRQGKAFTVKVSGQSLDARPLIKRLMDSTPADKQSRDGGTVTVNADIANVLGFGDETLNDVQLTFRGSSAGTGSLSLAARTAGGQGVSMDDARADGSRKLSASSGNAGAVLRFLNIYSRVEGGDLQLSLAGAKSLRGKLTISNFFVVNEPKLKSVVSSPQGTNSGLANSTKANIDTTRVQFDRGFADIDKGAGSLNVSNAVLRGPVIGTTFKGTVFDANNRMNLTGTFMPAYGLNSIFGDIPVLGAFLGNGRDGALIGVTYRLRGDLKSPTLEVNPLSVIAPGIFRTIFEY